jgi:hypothetical protein
MRIRKFLHKKRKFTYLTLIEYFVLLAFGIIVGTVAANPAWLPQTVARALILVALPLAGVASADFCVRHPIPSYWGALLGGWGAASLVGACSPESVYPFWAGFVGATMLFLGLGWFLTAVLEKT